jgi:hypothetical protein
MVFKGGYTRILGGSLVFAPFDHTNCFAQRLVKQERVPASPAPFDFVGHANGTDVPFQFTLVLYAVNGTKAVSGKYSSLEMWTVLMPLPEHLVWEVLDLLQCCLLIFLDHER